MFVEKNNFASLDQLPSAAEKTEKLLARIGLITVSDLLFHFPLRYQNRSVITEMAALNIGEEALIEGVIVKVQSLFGGKTKLFCELSDGINRIGLRFFHLLSFQKNMLVVGQKIRCYGQIREGFAGFEMFHPEFQILFEKVNSPLPNHLTPIYPTTQGLSQTVLRKLTTEALNLFDEEPAYDELLLIDNYPNFREALYYLHRPPTNADVLSIKNGETLAQQKLKLEELIAHRLSLVKLKIGFKESKGFSIKSPGSLYKKCLKSLPFSLTKAQKGVMHEILSDLMLPTPMLRLVQGDVGSGKTVIALLAIVAMVEKGYQAAFMAPTELLAEQHFQTFSNWVNPLGVNVVFLSGSIKAASKKRILHEIETGNAQIIIGTHALFQKEVTFKKLALIVVDEQHRFGVEQRAMLRKKGSCEVYAPHQLMMTATPIPRTLAMSFYANLDCSSIDELPKGRIPIKTTVLSATKRSLIIAGLKDNFNAQRQAYWVCPLIEESEVLNCQSATNVAAELQDLLPSFKVGLIHGRMKSDAKDAVMRAFQKNEIHLLVATTVIEVGVDIPNATIMVIENAERLGLSQLHQLRGRIGRGSQQSFCILLYQSPLSPIAQNRLKVIRDTSDGFKISQHDLELRGPGEVFGTKQTGAINFKIADLIKDRDLLPLVLQLSDQMVKENDPNADLLIERWLTKANEFAVV